MRNNHQAYYFRDVSEEDYAFLKEVKPHIWEEVKRKLYSKGVKVGEKELEKNKPGFSYNQDHQILAILIGEKQERRRIFSGIDFSLMSDLEKSVFCVTRDILGEALEGRNLEEEDWD